MSRPRRATMRVAAAVMAGAAAGFGLAANAAEPADMLSGITVDFDLVGAGGAAVTDEDFRGRFVLLSFGFTYCPDICPTTLATVKLALEQAGNDAAGVFISVDTERDTPDITAEYAAHFGDAIVGLSGDHEQVREAANNFRATYVVTKSDKAYNVAHTASIYLIGPDGDLVDMFGFDTPPAELAAAMSPS